MGKRALRLPASFSLLKSEFNDFLFAPVGDAEDHRPLTVLSALTCAELDPWQQAARLRQLPRERAVRNLAAILAALPDQPLASAEAENAAERLIALLPRRPSRKARLAAATGWLHQAVAGFISR